MIQPIGALQSKAFRENPSFSLDSSRNRTKRNVAIINATGISTVVGAASTIAARSYTSGWIHAGLLGAGASVITMMFIAPNLLYKADIGLNYTKRADTKIGGCSKNLLKKAV